MTAVAFTLAGQWGRPVAPKMIVAEATVESGLDPVGFPIRATNRAILPVAWCPNPFSGRETRPTNHRPPPRRSKATWRGQDSPGQPDHLDFQRRSGPHGRRFLMAWPGVSGNKLWLTGQPKVRVEAWWDRATIAVLRGVGARLSGQRGGLHGPPPRIETSMPTG